MVSRVEKKKDPATGNGLSNRKPKIALIFAPGAVAKFSWLNQINFLSDSISFIIMFTVFAA